MEINVVASGGPSPLVQRQGSSIAQPLARTTLSSSAGSDSRMLRDLGSVLDSLGLSSKGEGGGGSHMSIKDSLEAFINTMMGALQQQQEQQLALQQQQRQEQEQRKIALADNSESPLKRDLARLLETLDQQDGKDKESRQGGQNDAIDPLQSQLTKLLESSGAADSGITLKDVLSGLASKLPGEPADQKGYRVDTQV
ncbi:hypothetical protein LA366_21080 [Aeromonas jandaei]|uniref:Harpin HrpZ n=1 Tax=Aeromonas jandaei TaxID=650 RepID=A0A7T4A7M8_AERJA|nr:hypothetical protein [Aeromonas jandaei]QQB18824.1 hypothetical protein I6H43_14850 [Aeromonas jandaei]UCA33498.1 hypothetical protein LA366_21080 [Aeromonas jandaei]